jgi:hypothetical protein
MNIPSNAAPKASRSIPGTNTKASKRQSERPDHAPRLDPRTLPPAKASTFADRQRLRQRQVAMRPGLWRPLPRPRTSAAGEVPSGDARAAPSNDSAHAPRPSRPRLTLASASHRAARPSPIPAPLRPRRDACNPPAERQRKMFKRQTKCLNQRSFRVIPFLQVFITVAVHSKTSSF